MSRGTLVAVHAHPDDEAIFTAGATLWAAAAGYRVVLITCTNGCLGIDGNGLGGDRLGHDPEGTARVRAQELELAAREAGVHRLVTLNYDDSGMAGWSSGQRATAFVAQPVASVAERIAEVLRSESATVVLTYDANGFYGHPDHIMTHRATLAAVEQSPSVQRVYFPVMSRGVVAEAQRLSATEGIAVPAWVRDARGVDEVDIDVVVPTSPFAAQKQRAIALHASQIDNAEIVGLEPLLFTRLFGTETYQCGWSRDDVAGDRNNLFGGVK